MPTTLASSGIPSQLVNGRLAKSTTPFRYDRLPPLPKSGMTIAAGTTRILMRMEPSYAKITRP